ncbi:MAG: hypothetical protein IT450_14555 [Phycisphaerales bacterium]|nr:hypothetical protein [Phycisphaerales bacterium]
MSRRRRVFYLVYLVLLIAGGVVLWKLIPPETLKLMKETYYDLGHETPAADGASKSP